MEINLHIESCIYWQYLSFSKCRQHSYVLATELTSIIMVTAFAMNLVCVGMHYYVLGTYVYTSKHHVVPCSALTTLMYNNMPKQNTLFYSHVYALNYITPQGSSDQIIVL